MNNSTNILDLTDASLDWSDYTGSEQKYSLILDNITYMIKVPDPIRELRNDLSYMNNQFSEFVGCHIFESVGLPVQKTYLAKYNHNGKEVTVVACRDFINDGIKLYPMKFIHSKDIFESSNKNGKMTIQKVYDLIRGLKDPSLEDRTINRFWSVFVIDCLIGNYDRHLENWGLAKTSDGTRIPAPVYDCGSGLNPLKSDEALAHDMQFSSYRGASLAVVTPFSDENTGRRLRFKDIFDNMPLDLEKAIKEIFPRINLSQIYSIIQSTPFMSDIRKQAMIESIKVRYNQILLRAYVRVVYPDLSAREQNKIISSIKNTNNASLRKLGYVPVQSHNDRSQER